MYISKSCSTQRRGRRGGPDTYLPGRDRSRRAGESGRVRKGVEAVVWVLNRKLHNICSLAYGRRVNSQLCVYTASSYKNTAFRLTLSHSSLFYNSWKCERSYIGRLEESSRVQWRSIRASFSKLSLKDDVICRQTRQAWIWHIMFLTMRNFPEPGKQEHICVHMSLQLLKYYSHSVHIYLETAQQDQREKSTSC